jgi:hypothetical protein
MPTLDTPQCRAAIALRIIDEGRPVRHYQYDDGDAERGPWAREFRSFRLGPIWIERVDRPNRDLHFFIHWTPRRFSAPDGYPLDGHLAIYPGEPGYAAIKDAWQDAWARHWQTPAGIPAYTIR